MSAAKRFSIVLVVALVPFAASSASAARPPHPWCMVVQDRSGIWACAFDSFEQCREEAVPAHEGFCAPNPFYAAAPPAHAHRRTRR